MTFDSKIITTKMVCSTLIGAGVALGNSLSQWATSGETPNNIAWVVIIGGAIVGGANSLKDFLSSAFAEYKARNTEQTKP